MTEEREGPVTVFESNDPGLLAVAQSLLEDADIEFNIAGYVVSSLFPGGAAGPYGASQVQVPAERAAEARELLKDLGN